MLFAFLAIAIFGSVVFLRNSFFYENFCHHYYDLGIFVDGFLKFGKGDWNPYLSTRQILYFQDHWEPVMALISKSLLTLGLPNSAFLFEIGMFACAALSLLWVCTKYLKSPNLGAVLVILLLFSRDSFEAAFYAVHPSTWSVFPLVLISCVSVAYFIGKRMSKFTYLTLSISLSFACSLLNEQYSFVPFGLACAFLLIDGFKLWAFFILPGAVINIWWSFIGRQILFGESFKHTQSVKPTWENFVSHYNWDLPQLKSFLLFFAFYIPLYFLVYRTHKDSLGKHFTRSHFKALLVTGGIFGPLIAGRILGGFFGLHYNPVIVGFMVVLGLIFIHPRLVTTKHVLITFVFALAFSNNKFRIVFNAYANSQMPKCYRPISDSPIERKKELELRRERLSEIISRINSDAPTSNVMVSGSLIPNFLIRLNQATVVKFSDFYVTRPEFVDWVVIERNRFGNPWPHNEAVVEEAIKEIKTKMSNIQVIHDDEAWFVAKGHLVIADIKRYYFDQSYKAIE